MQRQQRLRRRGEYEAVFACDHVVRGRLFIVRARPNEQRQARLGIVAGRKALPRAVDRNRGKRLTREVFRQSQVELGALDIVVQLRSGLAKRDNAAAREELLALFANLGGCHRSAATPVPTRRRDT
ncbi:MAG: ribonuclease P protein component [Burkholderiales bacterium]|nr:ribonuclease P protein component [Burkholderiales bacterium]